MEEWKECRLGEIARFTTGKLNSNAADDNGIYPFFTCSPETFKINSYAFDTSAILLAGNNAEGNFNIKRYSGKFNAYQRTYVITVDKNTDLNFLFYALKLCLAEFKHISQGTATKFLTAQILNNFVIRIPPLPTQQKIAAILSSLDDKIELNNKINTNLEQQAQTLFKNWFVDFEPFGGKMPEGWKVGKLSEIGTIVGGSTPSKAKKNYYTNNGIAWITPKDLSNDKSKFISHGETDITELGFENSSAIKMPKGTVLYSSRAPIGYIAIAKNEVTTNQGFKSVIPDPNVGNAYIYYFLKSNFELIDNMASGSTFKEISGTAMKKVPVLIPDDKTLSKFQTMCETLFSQQELLENENRNLSATRDTLLPKLMNGEIEVNEVRI